MSTNNRTVTILDHQPAGAQSNNRTNKEVSKSSATPRKKAIFVFGATVIAIVAGYFVWNAFRYEDTDDAQVDGHIMPLSARINRQVLKVKFRRGAVGS